MDTKEVSGVAEDSPFGLWLLVSYGSKYGKGNGGTRNIGKAGNRGKMSGGGVKAVKIGVENISIDEVLGNGNVGKSEKYGSKNGKTSKNAFDKVGGSRFEVLNEEWMSNNNTLHRRRPRRRPRHRRSRNNGADVREEPSWDLGSEMVGIDCGLMILDRERFWFGVDGYRVGDGGGWLC
ncbi:hypothetical protein LWI28_004880 [Acer negundo]|uniref:Uncharacterized protein n=1 Tax=Acer negundo TaxID=4023 RepID=A0AAD5IYJ4_ACENE|nr:hypothetical protein LWI28_004880 [Acer negundo]